MTRYPHDGRPAQHACDQQRTLPVTLPNQSARWPTQARRQTSGLQCLFTTGGVAVTVSCASWRCGAAPTGQHLRLYTAPAPPLTRSTTTTPLAHLFHRTLALPVAEHERQSRSRVAPRYRRVRTAYLELSKRKRDIDRALSPKLEALKLCDVHRHGRLQHAASCSVTDATCMTPDVSVACDAHSRQHNRSCTHRLPHLGSGGSSRSALVSATPTVSPRQCLGCAPQAGSASQVVT